VDYEINHQKLYRKLKELGPFLFPVIDLVLAMNAVVS